MLRQEPSADAVGGTSEARSPTASNLVAKAAVRTLNAAFCLEAGTSRASGILSVGPASARAAGGVRPANGSGIGRLGGSGTDRPEPTPEPGSCGFVREIRNSGRSNRADAPPESVASCIRAAALTVRSLPADGAVALCRDASLAAPSASCSSTCGTMTCWTAACAATRAGPPGGTTGAASCPARACREAGSLRAAIGSAANTAAAPRVSAAPSERRARVAAALRPELGGPTAGAGSSCGRTCG